MRPFIITLIPAHNEESTIGQVVRKCKRYSSATFVIDDGSTDKTAIRAKDVGGIVIKLKKNRGVGAAIKMGYRTILKFIEEDFKDISPSNDMIIVNLDGDGQHNPDEIPKVIKPILEDKADFVIGSRFTGSTKDTSMIRRGGNVFFSFLVSILTRNKITDAQSGYRAINIRTLKKIKLKENFTNRQEMIIRVAKQKCRIKEVPINVNIRSYGKSFIQTKKEKIAFLFKVLLIVVRTYLTG